MRLLLDTNFLIALARRQLDARTGSLLLSPGNESFASAASLWEIAIKTRLGKLDPGFELDRLAGYYVAAGLTLLVIDHRHAVAPLDPEPPTRDPFDRMLLAQCAVEDLRLLTTDRALVSHPLAWRAT
jgi:PIN domain nuclease of toxin-antitoxin system